ncbi:MAG: chemotaxis protein CheC [Rhodoferax sp.]|nr:chemotaxis protein CheC [Rhodoferax sp.]
MEQDALTEIFNIGVGLAADALYQMTGDTCPCRFLVELTSQHEANSTFWRANNARCAPSAKPTEARLTPRPC